MNPPDREPTSSNSADAVERDDVGRIVQGEVREFLHAHEQRRRQLPRAIALGLLSGLTAVAFTRILAALDDARTRLIQHAHAYTPFGMAVPLLMGAVGAATAVWLARRFAPEAAGSGIPHLKAVLHRLQPFRGPRILAVKFAGGVAGIGSGLALGREGPTIQMGAALGQMVSQWFRCTAMERQTLIAAGAGAGLAAAFNAPLSGLVFVLEEVQRDFAPAVFSATLIAAVTADIVARLLNGQLPVFHVEAAAIPAIRSLPVALALGMVAGVLGVAFNRTLVATLDVFEKIRRGPKWATGAVAGSLVGAVGWFAPEVLGGGNRLVEETLAGQVSLLALPGFFVLRFILTMLSYGSGAPGGIFAPLLVLGSELGLGIGLLCQVEHPATFAVVGMAAYFSAIVRAPLTGIVLVVEMTGNYSLVLPLLVACLTAYGVADLLRDRPVYEALLERDLLRGQERSSLEGTLLLELTVAPGSPFDGRMVRDLGLPPGCVLVTIRRGPTEHVPTAATRLRGGDGVAVVVAKDAAEAVGLLRRGMAASG
jgi:CIC family chloride channel protein